MSIKPYVLTETEYVNQEELTYPFEERGLQFGDGVYEVIRVYHGEYYLIEEHVERLFRSAAAIKLEVPYTKEDMYKRLEQLLQLNAFTGDGKVYLQITRGSAPRDHAFPKGVGANLYAYVSDVQRKLDLMKDGISTITEPDVRWDLCYIKSLNLLPNVMAKQTATEQNCFEAVLHKDGKVTECSSSNVYLVKDGAIYTHPATKNILHGCVRMRIEAFAKEAGIPFHEEAFHLDDMNEADELFLTSSTAEVMPIVNVDGKAVANGTPGNITRLMQQAYEKDAGIPENASIFADCTENKSVS
ncbi:D-amino-acid transaminase [Pontibacillus yanchengensis]|uniref:D-amino-acid transaminase n=2 Tax=Pontibacillus yanchengensis TaxID=462910 RepID=A0ACC7VEE3_9BACI|nr:D-amino-acid transaminase [Pontibacillus yanchengensis]MYL32464.1 D-amino-acid transaminase [Pontibacillus yanchengensis]MYL53045.1 D-amino-acid transaminase [Pontibacillus yanchengensis]